MSSYGKKSAFADVDLHSIIDVPNADSAIDYIRFSHISFIDFLKDFSRSQIFFVDEVPAHIALGRCCFKVIISSESMRSYEVDLYAHTYYFSHVKKSRFDDDLLNNLRQHGIQSIVQSIISKINGKFEVLIQSILAHWFIFDFFTEGRNKCALPIAAKVQSIFDCIYVQIEDFLVKRLEPFEYSCFVSILAISEARKQRHRYPSLNQICYCWQGTILESRERGKHLYLGSKNSQMVFRKLWGMKQNSELTQEEEAFLPVVLDYLLKRVNQSDDFAKFLLDSVPALRFFLATVTECYSNDTVVHSQSLPFSRLSKDEGLHIVSRLQEKRQKKVVEILAISLASQAVKGTLKQGGLWSDHVKAGSI
ncbi:hypothetical protein BDQ17DRAFT_1434565 [Cyathus striatus]|nr:hypothetical protein BDQ17DRAFT_1434565 [Cyathus striatus]